MPSMTRKYCLTTSPRKMGFSQKASCKAQGLLKRTSKKYKGRYVISRKYNEDGSLYSNSDRKKSRTKIGYGNAKRASETLKNIKRFDESYQKQVVNTMYNRAKFHANQTSDMREAMKIFKKWLKASKSR
jgi:hypothetical protein